MLMTVKPGKQTMDAGQLVIDKNQSLVFVSLSASISIPVAAFSTR
jgi:hypothetical protein